MPAPGRNRSGFASGEKTSGEAIMGRTDSVATLVEASRRSPRSSRWSRQARLRRRPRRPRPTTSAPNSGSRSRATSTWTGLREEPVHHRGRGGERDGRDPGAVVLAAVHDDARERDHGGRSRSTAELGVAGGHRGEGHSRDRRRGGRRLRPQPAIVDDRCLSRASGRRPRHREHRPRDRHRRSAGRPSSGSPRARTRRR